MKGLSVMVTATIFLAGVQAIAQVNDPSWITATNKPCKIWNPEPQPNESVTWSGPCKDGFASGKGILRWTENGKPDAEFEGEYANGKRNGPGVMTTPDGQKTTGNWSDDELIPEDSNAI
jgi:hypothetical protein